MRRGLLSATALGALALALAAPGVAQAVRYAAPGGSGNDCDVDTPCTLFTALTGASEGEDVNLYADRGVYALPGEVSTPSGTTVHLHGIEGRPRLIFNTGGLRLQKGTADNLYVEGNGNQTAFALDTFAATAERVIAKADSTGHACYMQDATLKNSLCWAGTNSDLAVETDGSNVLRNVTAVGGTEAAILALGRTSGCSCATASTTLVNVIARSASGGTDIVGESDGTADVTINVSFSNFATTDKGGTTAEVNFNEGDGNQDAPPSFVNTATGDFHETASSETVDAGTTSLANGTVDLDGGVRTKGDSTDIGAYERSGSTPPGDTVAPETKIKRAKISKKNRKAKFTFKSTEPGSTFECKLDKKPLKSCTSPVKYKKLKAGKHTFKVRATDAAGNTDPTFAKKKFKIKPKHQH